MLASLRRGALAFLITFCISALLFSLAAVFVHPNVLGMLDFVEGGSAGDNSQLVNGFNENPNSSDTAVTSGFSAILVGTDHQPEVTPGASVQADTIIFVTVSETGKSFVYMPLPANMEVYVDGKSTTLGKVYESKGISYLAEKVTGLTGISVNYHAVVSMSNLEQIIDKLGGVEFSVPVKMEYEDPTQELVISLEKGRQTLTGTDAVKMLRYCSDSYSDRIKRNLNFLQTIAAEQAAPENKSSATELYVKLAPYITTNFTQNDLVKYMDLIWSYADFEEISLDYPGTYETDGDKTVFIPDTDKAIEILAEYKNS